MTTRYLRGSVIHNEHDPLDEGLVGEWRFDRNAGLLLPDSSGRGHHGDIRGATWQTGKTGPELYFDGNDDVVVTNPSLPTGNAPFTFLQWFNTDDTESDANDVWLYLSLFWGTHDGAGKSGYATIQEDRVRFETFGQALVVYDPPAPQNGKFHLFAVSYDSVTVRLYYDGIERDSFVHTLAIVDAPLYIGSWVNQRYYEGSMAGTWFYNRDLNAGEHWQWYKRVLRRMQTFGGERRFPVGFVAAVPPAVGPFLTTGGGYSLPVG